MGIEQEYDALQSMLSQVLNSLTEAQSRAKGLPDCDIHELNREIAQILEVCYDGLSRLQNSLNQIELIQGIIGDRSGGDNLSRSRLSPTVSLAVNATPVVSVLPEKNVSNDPDQSSQHPDRAEEETSGETSSTRLGKEVHAERAEERRASG